jgi:ubiquinone/menaquinone biosynthesis C-methylase UbiE
MTDSAELKAYLADVFTRVADSYDQVGPPWFSYFGQKLATFAEIDSGMQILDVACGRGAVLIPAAELVGWSGEAVGTDIAQGMVEECRRLINERRLAHSWVTAMDAEQLGLPNDYFDAAFCGMGLFFLPHPERALAEMYRVLKPGGQVVVSTFKRQRPNPRTVGFWMDLNKEVAPLLRPAPELIGDQLNTQGRLKQVFTAAGFGDIEICRRQQTTYLQDANEWWDHNWSHGFRAYLERIPPEHRPFYLERVAAILERVRTTKGIPDKKQLYFTRARKPVAPEHGAPIA